ncbi:MAG: hypothetical protein U1F76_09895 [Candidatus Competibacteraceae bacterium]
MAARLLEREMGRTHAEFFRLPPQVRVGRCWRRKFSAWWRLTAGEHAHSAPHSGDVCSHLERVQPLIRQSRR